MWRQRDIRETMVLYSWIPYDTYPLSCLVCVDTLWEVGYPHPHNGLRVNTHMIMYPSHIPTCSFLPTPDLMKSVVAKAYP